MRKLNFELIIFFNFKIFAINARTVIKNLPQIIYSKNT